MCHKMFPSTGIENRRCCVCNCKLESSEKYLATTELGRDKRTSWWYQPNLTRREWYNELVN